MQRGWKKEVENKCFYIDEAINYYLLRAYIKKKINYFEQAAHNINKNGRKKGK